MSFAAVQKHVAVLEAAPSSSPSSGDGREQLVRGNVDAVRDAHAAARRSSRRCGAAASTGSDEILADDTDRRSELMTVTNVAKDPDALTMTITAEFDAPIERVWKIWEDPRQLERWWGPPTYPATVVDHDLRPAGASRTS